MKPTRLDRLPKAFSAELKAARLRRGWSQAELGRQVGLPQAHISGIETGRIVPRFDTLLDVVRVLDLDLVLVPRSLVPAVGALVRDARGAASGEEERPLYAFDDDDDDEHEDLQGGEGDR
ncbi:MAG: helix-turn-helix transcriptional regulator [Alphaproteobacteria bacterium]